MRTGIIHSCLIIIILFGVQFCVVGQQESNLNNTSELLANTTGPIISDSTYIDNYVKNLDNGKLIYNPPFEMTVNTTESINATIIKGNVTGGESIKVAPYMEVNLNGPAFNIEPITESRQFIAGTDPTIWKWNVIPKKIGNQSLDLLAYVIIRMPDGHEEKRALVKDKTIYVQINPKEKQTSGAFISLLLESPWVKVLGAFSGFVAFVALFFREDILEWFRSKRRKQS
jgi:hypothetical protein